MDRGKGIQLKVIVMVDGIAGNVLVKGFVKLDETAHGEAGEVEVCEQLYAIMQKFDWRDGGRRFFDSVPRKTIRTLLVNNVVF